MPPRIADQPLESVDFVIKFEGIPRAYAEGTKRASPELLKQRADELERLMARLRQVGLVCVSRAAPGARGFVYVFVRITQTLLQEMRHTEHVRDFLHGVMTPSELSEEEPFSPAQRVRYTHKCITSPFDSASTKESGAGVTPHCAEFPHVVDMMPLHDPKFNSAWLRTWSRISLSSIINGIDLPDIDKLRDQFGASIAMYFAFLNTYFQALAPIAMAGLVFWFSDRSYSRMYACLVVLWAIVFVEIWRIRERMLAVRWNITGVSSVSERNNNFKPAKKTLDSVTGREEEVFEGWRRDVRRLLCLPITILFLVFLVATMAAIFLLEVVVKQVYDGPAKSFVALIPTILFSTAMPLIQSAWRATAQVMAHFENHATMHTLNSSLTFKVFGMQAIVTYGILALTAYMYIPFFQFLMDWLNRNGYLDKVFGVLTNHTYMFKKRDLHFQVSPNGLHDQLFAMSVTQQITNTFMEVLLPILMRHAEKFVSRIRRSSHKQEKRDELVKPSGDLAFIERVESEFELSVYDEFTDYAEMTTQMGVIALWSVLWPLAPVMSVVNNVFELRSDAFKLVVNMRRPVPRRVESIGSWLDMLGLLAHLSVFTNASMLFMFDALKPNSNNPFKPTSDRVSQRIRLWIVAFGFALLCNQVFSIARSIVRFILERTMWQNSKEDLSIRRRLYMNRVSLIQRFEAQGSSGGSRDQPMPRTALATSRLSSQDAFWDPASDTGLSFILSAKKEA